MLLWVLPSSPALIASVAMGVACAVLSVLVVLRRWAFIGEGIAHAGFGGVGTAWLLSLALPSLAGDGPTYGIAVAFCLLTAWGIALLTRRQRVHSDTAIGIFLVASLAWGFSAQGAYMARRHVPPPGWENYLMGQVEGATPGFALAAVCIAVLVLLVLALLGKEILSYCFDPALAELSGVPAGLVHYLLITLLAIAIIVGMRLMGSLLVTALLVLPGAAALQWSRRLRTVLVAAALVGLLGAVGGALLHAGIGFIPHGAAIALVLLAEFLVSALGAALTRRGQE